MPADSQCKSLVLAYVEALNRFDMVRLRELFASDARIHGVLGYGGLDVAEPVWRELHEGLQMRLEPLAIIEEGNQVVVRFRESGRFVGHFRGLAGLEPTGKPYELTAIEWFEIVGGRIASRWAARDSAAILRQVFEIRRVSKPCS